MTTIDGMGLFGLLGSVAALVALIWALGRRKLRVEDNEMYAAMSDDEPDFTSGLRTPPLTKRGIGAFVLAISAVVVIIGWLVAKTVIEANAIAHSPAGRELTKHSSSDGD